MLALPVEISFGAASAKRAGMAVFEIFARLFEAFVDMPDAAFGFLIDLPPYFSSFPALRREVQLGPRLGPGCDTPVALRFGYDTGSGAAELLTHRS